MPQSTRFVVKQKPSRTGRGTWCVCDRQARKVDSRYLYRESAEMVATALEAIHLESLPYAALSATPAEIDDRDPIDPADRLWWARQDADAEYQESALSAFLDRCGPDDYFRC